ncbi:MAG: type II toxin-antitoxin system RelE/ParE family toxin [Halobaculum sp.]
MTDVFFTERGKARLDELDSAARERIETKLREARDWPDHFLESLRGRDDYLLRVGDYRALIQWERNEDGSDVLYVKSVGHRRNFYDREL